MKPKMLLIISAFAINVAIMSAFPDATYPETVNEAVTVTDQLGRHVVVPKTITRIAAFHHMASKIVYALGVQDKLVGQAFFRNEGEAIARMDPAFAGKPQLVHGHAVNNEAILALKPDLAIVYASFDASEVNQMENAGIRVIAVKGETIKESFESVRLLGRILNREKEAEGYIAACERLVNLTTKRLDRIPAGKKLKVMFSGPRNMYTVATGEMLQSRVLEGAGAFNVARGLKGFWAAVSPEQIVAWNPDVIFLGSGLDSYGVKEILANTQLQGVKAVRNKRIYIFPSNVGWWDYPAPHCVLGTVWAAKTLYPEQFVDIDIKGIADKFYRKYMGYTFTSMGGKL
jgi:iron complex transport system substrate-binding protein